MNPAEFLLLLVPSFPLLLAIPALRRYIPGFQYLAILPIIAVSFLVQDSQVELPWLLLGTGFATNSDTQILLLMSCLFWIPAARLLAIENKASGQAGKGNYRNTFFLLTLAGYAGAILTTDLIGFFTFSTLIGYGFYGLLCYGAEQEIRRTARIYLCLIVVADLLLFEALLVARSVTVDLNFETFHEVMAASDSIGLYLTMVLLGFSLKGALWPFNFWLVSAFRRGPLKVKILLSGVPVGAAMLGLVHWLPLGEILMPDLAILIKGLGAIAIAYAVFQLVLRRQGNAAAYATFFASGGASIFLGIVLSAPQRWGYYEHFVIISIACLGPGIAILSLLAYWLRAQKKNPVQQNYPDDSASRFETMATKLFCLGAHFATEVVPRLGNSHVVFLRFDGCSKDWLKKLHTVAHILQHWPVAIALFILVGITVALLVG